MVEEVTLQELGPGVMGYVDDALSSHVWKAETVEVAGGVSSAYGSGFRLAIVLVRFGFS